MEKILAELYETFAPVETLNDPLDVCLGCCMDFDVHQTIRNTPREDITAGQMLEYNTSGGQNALTYLGEYKHFLPRMIELLTEKQEIGFGYSQSFRRFKKATAEYWTDHEIKALQNFARAYFFHESSRSYKVSEVVECLSNLPIDIEMILDIWLENLTPFSLDSFANIMCHEIDWTQALTDPKTLKSDHSSADWVIINWFFRHANLEKMQAKIEKSLNADWNEFRFPDEIDWLYSWVAKSINYDI